MNPDGPPPEGKPPVTRGTIWARRLIALLFGLAAALLLLEGLLSLDPVGLRYIRDYVALTDEAIPAPAGYTYAPGEYRLSRSLVTMRADGTRLVPASGPDDAPGPLVFVGDSVTFGLGVSDDETFVNLIAQRYPGRRVINAGIPAYNIVNIRAAIAKQPPDAQIVYLISDNDADPLFEPPFGPGASVPYVPWTALYIRFLPVVLQATDPNFGNPATDLAMFEREVAAVAADPRVTLVGYDSGLTPLAPGAYAIAGFSTRLSFADKHPDANGHRELAEQIAPLIPPDGVP